MKKRTNIFLNEALIRRVMSLAGAKSKREAVEIALQQYVHKALLFEQLKKLKGKLSWTGNLNKMRKNRT